MIETDWRCFVSWKRGQGGNGVVPWESDWFTALFGTLTEPSWFVESPRVSRMKSLCFITYSLSKTRVLWSPLETGGYVIENLFVCLSVSPTPFFVFLCMCIYLCSYQHSLVVVRASSLIKHIGYTQLGKDRDLFYFTSLWKVRTGISWQEHEDRNWR